MRNFTDLVFLTALHDIDLLTVLNVIRYKKFQCKF